MRVYVSTNCLFNFDLQKTLSLYAQSGINKIELSSYPDIAQEDDIYKTISRYPADYLVHNYFPPPLKPFVFNLASENPEISQKSLTLAKKAIKLCNKINSLFYSFHGGFLYDPSEKLEKNSKTFIAKSEIVYSKEKALKIFLKNLLILKKTADKNNIGLLIENNVCPPILKNKLLFVDHQDFLWLFSQKGMENIAVLLDTGHLRVSAKTYGFSVFQFIDKLKNKIKAIHLHDNNGKADLHQKIKAGSWVENVIKKMEDKEPTLILETHLKNLKQILSQKNYLENLIS